MSEEEKQPQEEQIEYKRSPWVRMASAYYQLDLGQHPKLADDSMFNFDPVIDELIEDHFLEYSLPLIPCIDGHNVMTTNGVASLLDTEVKIPISPNFVRDIAGRIIYTGYGPEKKGANQWQNNRHITFPKNCRIVTTDIEGANYIENVFFTRFRTLDSSMIYEDMAHQELLSYEGENLYPYKLRLDTFYQDGWRLPQTNMLYARKSTNQNKAKNIGIKFLEEWQKVKSNTFYEEFIDANGGSVWFEKLFQAGCTIIPTKEAYNGHYVVDNNYAIENRKNGCAIEGLHEVVATKASEEPKGTILEVITPGFITATHIRPAQVTVSKGERYIANKKAFPIPSHPDLRLPHQRTQSVWSATWLPTHPSHFDETAIWGWDMATGHFLQLTGPLWDPLHYYYESTPLVVKSFKQHEPEGRHLAFVPKEMKERFYPISAIKGFDMSSYGIRKMRNEKNILPKSSLLRVKDTKFSSNIGYHPLPYSFEYELSHLWFPELMPTARTPTKPNTINITPVIMCNTTKDDYHNNAPDMNEFERLKISGLLKEPSHSTLNDYPQLHRYFSDFSPQTVNMYGKILLNIPDKGLESVSTLYSQSSLNEIIKVTEMPFYSAVKTFREKSLNSLNKLIDVYNSDFVSFIQKYWKSKS